MKNLWFYSGLLFVLTILGIGGEQAVAPNQVVVIQFADTEISAEETQETIGRIKSQLEGIAVSNIQLEDQGNGSLKLTYYSDIPVPQIHKLLLQEQALSCTLTADEDHNFPIDEEERVYQIGVQKIQDVEGFAGTKSGVLELKSEIARFSNPKIYGSVQTLFVTKIIDITNENHIIYPDVASCILTTSYNIPEVRAGPRA
ncbi:hypothetical protein EAX61_00360 [Dokdonia sinensis]|uniref:Uncharacterized protein n=1 Tax=Dokdonia sinensis TaxID=2479847 RepID=A0A3M0GGS2_9FLAO|nr:hypothetical protein [Dokdonia sinensis]RMB63874.1 hypothetical protein EAX61_00360 [Dokdonia sinensis]